MTIKKTVSAKTVADIDAAQTEATSPAIKAKKADVNVELTPIGPAMLACGTATVGEGDVTDGVHIAVGFRPRHIRVLQDGEATEFMQGMDETSISVDSRGFTVSAAALKSRTINFVAQA